MKKYLFRILLFYLIMPLGLFAQFRYGTGTFDDPFLIFTADEFEAMKNYDSRNGYSGDEDEIVFFFLMSDINMEEIADNEDADGWTPLGDNVNGSSTFYGELFGNHYTVYNLKINKPSKDYVGLFGYKVPVIDLNISNADIHGHNYVGAVEGGSGIVTNCHVSGSVEGNDFVGGIIGWGVTSFSSNTCNVVGHDYVGGISGGYGIDPSGSGKGTLLSSNSFSTSSSIVGNNFVGGLYGIISISISIENCFSNSNVNASGSNIGGLIGEVYHDGDGLLSITNSYSSGSVSGESNCGGLIGSSIGSVTIEDCFWDIEASGQSTSGGGMGKTTEEMKTSTTFTDAGWDFFQEDANGLNDYWQIDLARNNGYPFLIGSYVFQFELSTSTNFNYTIRRLLGKSKYYKLTDDIDLSVFSNWEPFDGIFNGILDGNGFNVKNLTFNRPEGDSVGLFRELKFSKIFDLAVEVGDSNITGAACVGVLCGAAYFTVFDNVNIKSGILYSGKDFGNYYGGLAGSVLYHSFLVNCTNSTEINTVAHQAYDTGGLVGKIWASQIIECKNSGNIIGYKKTGGLIGTGSESDKIYSSFNTGNVSGSSNVGGLIGMVGDYGFLGITVNNCFSRGDVTGTSGQIGGAFGIIVSSSDINYCYSTGNVTGTQNETGGLIGSGDGATYSNCFWDTESSGLSTSDGGVGKTTSEMKTISTFTDAGWDFDSETNNGTNDFWEMDESQSYNDGYPYLSWIIIDLNLFNSGNGSSLNPYIIVNEEQLSNINYFLGASKDDFYFALGADVDCSTIENWTPIGNNNHAFYGQFDGKNFTISNLKINRTGEASIGLFGVTNNAIISNTNVIAHQDGICGGTNTGGIVGFNFQGSRIENCSFSGNVSGANRVGGICGSNATNSEVVLCRTNGSVNNSRSYTGGLVGYNYGTSLIEKSYSNSTVSANGYHTGGLVGENYSSSIIRNCYATGEVNASNYVGGLVGTNGSQIEFCYSTGLVNSTSSSAGGLLGYSLGGSVSNSYWDTQTSDKSTSAAGIGKTTEQMKTQSTFVNWDFDTIWIIIDGDGANYPSLQENGAGTQALPVQLTFFTASTISDGVLLNWQTATEINNHGFEVQRANVNKQHLEYETIGFVEGAGNSNSPKKYSYSDNLVISGKYTYRLKQIDLDGSYKYSKEIEVTVGSPGKFELVQNYPNPFNPTTKIKYALPKDEFVTLKVYNSLGQEVTTLVNQNVSAGYHTIDFDASNLASGMYIYRIKAGNFISIKKMLLLK